ncbi:hypothetical protein [Lacticaseibacillus porcinae]|uniref:hypothetical protein n=1 Tax=Lacticaseibacillus porcinae TaxID=1123687 RepID=UPI0013DE0793|nr:hypothetical protein [Lacticaseibacillus porcinae]
MMAVIKKTDRLIINRLFDQEMFTTTASAKQAQQAILAYQRPDTQRRVNRYLTTLIGQVPMNFQDNLLLLSGPGRISTIDLQILLATIKAVINSPEQSLADNEGLLACQPIVTSVRSRVSQLEERDIRKIIDAIFVDRFKLFKVRRPDIYDDEHDQEIEEYWDISPDFLAEAQNIIMYLQSQTQSKPLTPVQQVNVYLLQHRAIDASKHAQLWATLQANKVEIAMQWAQLERFYLECSDHYAMLLDAQRQPLKSRAFFVAVKVSQHLGDGVEDQQLNTLIQSTAAKLYPQVQVTNSDVRELLLDLALAKKTKADYWRSRPMITRFEIVEENTDGE